MSDSYLIPARASETQFREKMSRFISFAIPVQTAAEAKQEAARIANEYHDARHVCYAYAIGRYRNETYSTDNGEPSGTAGRPILGQIVSAGVSDVVVVVVRYFGGIKLGTSGLIQAYREAAAMALAEAGTEEKTVTQDILVTFPYIVMNEVMKIAKSGDVKVVNQEFDNTCRIMFRVRESLVENIGNRISDIDGAMCEIITK